MTCAEAGATLPAMENVRIFGSRTGRQIGLIVLGSLALSGCITVNAPSEPIVIELNINITQEVVYRLAKDVTDTIEENPGIF
ncbi:MAG: YnbE family lipoprotein [Pontixanthobacter sp.]